jgi:hypothetical protein
MRREMQLLRVRDIWVCFCTGWPAACPLMSLNRNEQMFSDYVGAHPEEKRFWEEKVRVVAAGAADGHAAAVELERELWRYFKERGQVVPSFREAVAHPGSSRVSLRNLAELWLRLWAPPRPKPKANPGDGTADGPSFA